MDALRGIPSIRGAESIRALPVPFALAAARSLAWAIAGTMLLAGSALFVRRAAGAFVAPPPIRLLATGLAALVATLAARVAWRAGGLSVAGARSEAAFRGALTAGLVLLAVALTLPGGSTAALAVFWMLLVAAVAVTWRGTRRPRIAAVRAGPQPFALPHAKANDSVWQQVSREHGIEGGEVARGWLRAEFAAGQRTAAAHVALCPPLPNVPQVTVRQTAGPEARLKAAQVLPHGIRFEIKLAAPADRRHEVRLEFSAVWPGVRGASP